MSVCELVGKRNAGVWVLALMTVIAPWGWCAPEAPYLVPKMVYVGDAARLVVPLGGSLKENIVASGEQLPSSAELTFIRAELDAKTNALLLDFRAWTPGPVTIPAFSVGPLSFEPLEVTISSILENDPHSRALSPSLGPLSAPGSIGIIAGVFAAAGIVLLFGVIFSANGGAFPRRILEKFRRAYLLRSMRRIFRRLRARTLMETADRRVILEWLSSELRGFISLYTGTDCRSFVPREFLPERELCAFFERCDTRRFSGDSIDTRTVFLLIDEAEQIMGQRIIERRSCSDAERNGERSGAL
jgi:hypothetical protein